MTLAPIQRPSVQSNIYHVTLWIQSIVHGNAILAFFLNTEIACAIQSALPYVIHFSNVLLVLFPSPNLHTLHQRPSRNLFTNASLVLFLTPNLHAPSSAPLLTLFPKVLLVLFPKPIITYAHPGARLRKQPTVGLITPSNQDCWF